MPETSELMNLKVPYYTQKEEQALQKYGRKACGLTSLRMVLSFYEHPLDIDQLKTFANLVGAYKEETGWIHAGLLNIARELGLKGYRINFDMLTDEDLTKACPILAAEGASLEEVDKFTTNFTTAKTQGARTVISQLLNAKIPIITSMKTSYANTIASHMVVIKGEDKDKFIINDPWDFGPDHLISKEEFEQHWTKRAIVIWK